MIIGHLEITAALNHEKAVYAAQEDVNLAISFKNMSDSTLPVPYLLDHLVTYILKDLDHGSQKTVEHLPPVPAGVPRLTQTPTAPVEPQHTETYTLALQGQLGQLSAGKYSVQVIVQSPAASFTTQWMDFSILPMKVAAPSMTPFCEVASSFLHLTWRDEGMNPPAILHRTIFIGQGSTLASNTSRIGQGDSTSEPVAAVAPDGGDPGTFWVGWLSGAKLMLSRVHGDEVATNASSLPAHGNFRLVPSLAHSEKPSGGDLSLSGAICGKDGNGFELRGFHGIPPASLSWTDALRIPSGELLAIRMLGVSSSFRCIFWARLEAGKLNIESAYWHDAKGLQPGPTLLKVPLTQAKGFRAFDAVSTARGIRWAALLRGPSGPGEPDDLQCWTHSLVGPEYRSGPGVPKASHYSAKPGPAQISMKLNPEGVPWILQKDIQGGWIQSPEWKDHLPIELPRGSRFESLYFKRGTLPKVSYLDPEKGFESKAVLLPGEGVGTDSEDPANR
jgi:hypothetical protein